ncbi:MAG: hypothetical protein HND39_01750 [Ignavibacteriota bacterium]|nr:hypothetical protein [Ignavibacteriota bacterium]MCC7094942.1 hypothetical protein [Ignavibacteriaceae bacterium]MCE7856233.1 hypothetical protein [Ignavibacteria bacterium CHB3]MEB2297667.1 hypothetical protein [Ignavibacteria bacterium]NUM61291.1 hypothetical protein [Ignavibacteriaceae bacterium]
MKSSIEETLKLIPNLIVDPDKDRMYYVSLKRFDLLQHVPNYKEYFDEDNRKLLDIVGPKKYFILFDLYHKTGLYLRKSKFNYFMEEAKAFIGDEHFSKIKKAFPKVRLPLRRDAIDKLIHLYLSQHKKMDCTFAARVFDISIPKVNRFKKDNPPFRKPKPSKNAKKP